MSNAELRGANVIWALSFLEDFEWYGFDTYKVPVEVSKPSECANLVSVFEFIPEKGDESLCNNMLSLISHINASRSLIEINLTWSADAWDEIKAIPLESLTFRHFPFNNILDIIDFTSLLQCGYLEYIALVKQIPQEFSFKCPGESKKPNIERLTLRSNEATSLISILLHPRSPVGLSSLHYLNINVSSENCFDFAQLLRCVLRLKFLEIGIDSSFDYDPLLSRNSVMDLSFVPSLVSLDLQLRLLLARVDPIPWIVGFLSTVGPQNTLEDIFALDKSPPTFTIQALENTLAEWRRLDHILTQSPFSDLRRIHLVFVLDDLVDDQSLRQISDEFIAQLQGLSGKGVFEVECISSNSRNRE